MQIAVTRDVAPSLAQCELTHLARQPIDVGRAAAQHRAYCDRLQAFGLEVVRLPADPAHPDCCFVEDPAVVLDELAVIAPLGAASRRGESAAIEAALTGYRRIERIALPATLDGGDVLQLGRRVFVGLSSRTNAAGIAALRTIVAPLGYEVTPVTVTGCLHLKTAVTSLDDETLLANPAWFDVSPLAEFEILPVAADEPTAANVLRVGGALWGAAGSPRTLDRLDSRGYRVTPVDISELAKAEAGLTCMSLLFRR
jgi:dimethylargininase